MSKTIEKKLTPAQIARAKKASAKKEKALAKAPKEKVEAEKPPLPALANDASPELLQAIAKAFKICKTLKVTHAHKSCERLSKSDKYSIKVPSSAKSAISKLHLKLTGLNRLNDRMEIGQSRKLAVVALISSGALTKVPETLAEYCKTVLAPLCASGHITCPYHTTSNDKYIFVSGPNMDRAHLQASPTDALKMLLAYCFAHKAVAATETSPAISATPITCRYDRTPTDVLHASFFPSVKYISDALAQHNK